MSGVDSLLAKELSMLNLHLPEKRKTLIELLSEDRPFVVSKRGDKHFFDKEELRRISDILPTDLHDRLQLPIFIELGSEEVGPGTARVTGREACELVRRVLNLSGGVGDKTYLHRLQVQELRRRLPTTTQYLFLF